MAYAALLVPPDASAHSNPTLTVRLTDVSSQQPDGVVMDVLDSERTYLLLGNASSSPVYALDPAGEPFLEVSADGVYGDISSKYLAASPRAKPPDEEAERECCPEGSWVRLSGQSSWIWSDPRLDPPLRDDTNDDSRGLGALSSEPLAVWEIPFEGSDGEFVASGVVERKQVGRAKTVVTDQPPAVNASIIEARPPQIRLQVEGNHLVEVLGQHDKPFLRVTSTGAVARADSAEYKAHLRAARIPEERAESGWVPVAGSGPGRVTWADVRIDYSAKVPGVGTEADGLVINRWRIPLRIDGERTEIVGYTDWTDVEPPNLAGDAPGNGFWRDGGRNSYLIAGGMTLAVIAAYLIARMRKKVPQ